MRKSSFVIALFALFSLDAFAQAPIPTSDNAEPAHFSNMAQLQILNKTTAKTSIVEIKVGNKSSFGSLDITVHKCWEAPLDQRPESKILIDVEEIKVDENKKEQSDQIFYGWLFASSPSISGLEHPIYDIVAIGCKNK